MESADTVSNLLFPAETAVCDKQLPAETVCLFLHPAEMLSRVQNHTDSLDRKSFVVDG